MPATTVLRALVITEVVLLIASTLTVFLPSEPTPGVDEYLEGPGAGPLVRLLDADPTAATYAVGALLVVFVSSYVASLVGLLCLTWWARRLYVASFVAGACIYPFMGSWLVDPISGTFEYLAAVCGGAVLATLYLSDAKVIFEKRSPDQSPERTREG